MKGIVIDSLETALFGGGMEAWAENDSSGWKKTDDLHEVQMRRAQDLGEKYPMMSSGFG